MSNKRVSVLSAVIFRFALICLACPVLAHAQTTINVPADLPTIQAGIDVASNGDTVLVAPGTYIENLDFLGKAITVTSSDGPAVTIIDGGAGNPVVTFQSNEDTNSVLHGFTLQNGVPSQAFPISGTSGGGILILNASPTVTGNVITDNHAICGIGIEIQGGSAVIQGNTITGNAQAFGDGGCGGGGIEITGDSSHPPATPQITGNTITNNSLNGGGFGGGIEVSFFASPIIQNNYIAGNSAWNSGGGIDLESYLAPVVVQNIIVNNSTLAGGSGAGMNVQGPSSSVPVVVNNTIAGNNASDGSSGIFANVVSLVIISNNIVVSPAGQNAIVCDPSNTNYPVFSNNDAMPTDFDGEPYLNCGFAGRGPGNFSEDPQFVNAPRNDYHLQGSSRAVDRGDNSAPNLPQQDYDGKPRVTSGNPDTCTDNVDIGAYEFVLTTAPAASLSSTALDFGSVVVGSSSTQTLIFTATQGCVFKPTVSVTGDFHATDNCTEVLGTQTSLGTGAGCAIFVTFSPLTSGPSTGSLSITSGSISASTSLTGQGTTAIASLSPASLSFADQLVNTASTAQTVTLSNTGSGTLQISSISVTGDFSQSNTCPASLAPGATCTIQITFQPTATGARNGSLTVSSNSVPTAATLAGTGVQTAISLSPASINFADQPINTSAPDQIVTVTNTGTAALVVTSTLVSGSPFFNVILNNCAVSVPPAGSCTIEVGFTPTTAGAASAKLTINSNAPTTPSVALSGRGINPIGSLSPSALTFGDQQVNTSSAAQTVTLSNTGTDPLSIAGVSVSGDFTQSNTCPASLGVSTSCTIQVTFQPTATGVRSGSLIVSSNSVPAAPAVALNGTGVQPAISVSPASVNFADQPINTTGPDQMITVTNAGTGTLVVNSTLVSGSPYLNVILNNCTVSVPPAGTCTIEVEFTPRSTGAASATLTIGSNAPTTPTVALSGKGIDPTGSLSPSGLDFGNQQVNTNSAAQTVTLTNTGTDPLSISAISVGGAFTVSNTCPASLAVGSSCAIQVTFHPTATGTSSGFLSVSSNSSPPVVSDFVTGTGVNPSISVSPASIAFGNTTVGTDAPVQTVTVSNPGTTMLHVNSLTMSGDADFFTVTNNCVGGTGVVPGGSCTIQMEFQPRTAGPGSATLTVGSDASNGAVYVALSGTGVSPATVSVSPSVVNFGSQAVGTQSTSQTVTVSSTGTGPLHISSLAISGDVDFSILNSNCPVGSGMTQGASCIVQVAFAPKALGPGSATLTITSDASNGPVSVALSGSGIDYAVSAPASLSVRSGSKVQTTVTVSAVGGNFSNAVALSCSGLPSGASCSFSPASVVPGAASASSSLSINTQQSGGIKTPFGTYTIIVNGTSGSSVHSAPITLTVTK